MSLPPYLPYDTRPTRFSTSCLVRALNIAFNVTSRVSIIAFSIMTSLPCELMFGLGVWALSSPDYCSPGLQYSSTWACIFALLTKNCCLDGFVGGLGLCLWLFYLVRRGFTILLEVIHSSSCGGGGVTNIVVVG